MVKQIKMSMLRRNIIFNLVGQASVIILGFISFKYIYAGLGADALGIIYFSLMLSALLKAALDMGLSKTTIRELAAHYDSEPDYIKKLTQTFSLFYLLAYVLVTLLFVLFLPVIVDSWIKLSTMDKELAHYVLLVIGITSLLAIPRAFMSSICIGMQRMDVNNSIDVSVAIIQQLGMVMLLVEGRGIVVVAYWLAATNILRILVYVVFISRLLSFDALLPRFSRDVVVRVKEYTSKMMWVSILLVIHKQLDKVLISKLLPIGVFGVYSFAYTSISKTTLITGAVAQAVFPSFSELENQEKQKKLFDRFSTLQDLLVFGTVPIFALAVFINVPLFTFLLDGEKARMLQLPILLLCIGFYLNATLRLVSTYVSAVGKPEYIVDVTKFLLVVSTPIAILLIVKFGVSGAALSWIIYYVLASLYMVPKVYKRELCQSPGVWFKSVTNAFVLVCLTYIPAWIVTTMYFPGDLLSILLCYVSGTVVYGVIALNMVGSGLQKVVLNNIPGVSTVMINWGRG